VWFVVFLFLAQHMETVCQMRHLPFILAGILLPTLVTPLLLDLWTHKGTANANFVFFSLLVMWLFYVLGLIEFLTAHLKHN
jgi:hypothetical protein